MSTPLPDILVGMSYSEGLSAHSQSPVPGSEEHSSKAGIHGVLRVFSSIEAFQDFQTAFCETKTLGQNSWDKLT